VWMPLNYLLIEALYCYHTFYGDEFRLECPSRSGKLMTLAEIADTIALRVKRLFLRDANGRRPIFGDNALLQNDPAFRDHLLFNEYFDGDTGAGLGASHQTGWSALIAMLLKPRHEREAVQPAPAEVTTR